MEVPSGPLRDLKVLDLSRVLAGPWASQLRGDLGADVVKVERPAENGKGGGLASYGLDYSSLVPLIERVR